MAVVGQRGPCAETSQQIHGEKEQRVHPNGMEKPARYVADSLQITHQNLDFLQRYAFFPIIPCDGLKTICAPVDKRWHGRRRAVARRFYGHAFQTEGFSFSQRAGNNVKCEVWNEKCWAVVLQEGWKQCEM